MKKEHEIAALFRELSPENQETLLACARVSRTVESAVKKRCGRSIEQGTGPKHAASRQDSQEGVSFLRANFTQRN
jgi:HEPN domain-containing protein